MSKKPKQAAGSTGAPTGVVLESVAGPAAQEAVKAQDAPVPAGLFGSSVQPSMLDIGGQQVQLGTVVAAAHKASELSVEDWNALAVDVRESLIADEVAQMAADAEAAGTVASDPPAEPVAVAATYPRSITLRNHSGFAVTEPATGAFVGGGASVHVTVHDEAQAVRVLQNARSIKSRTGGRQSLVVAGLGDVVLAEETGDAP